MMQREDALPWYRQFWPWFIIALPASAVVAGLYTVWLSLQTTDSLAIRTDEGMQVVTERNLAAIREANRAGITARAALNRDTGAVQVSVRSENEIETASALTLTFSHPTIAAHDVETQLHKALPDSHGNPVWTGYLVDVPVGRYYIVLESGDNWRLSGEWNGESQFDLGAPADDSP